MKKILAAIAIIISLAATAQSTNQNGGSFSDVATIAEVIAFHCSPGHQKQFKLNTGIQRLG